MSPGPIESSSNGSNEPIGFGDLPDELIPLIFSHLDGAGLKHAASVSKAWNASVLEVRAKGFESNADQAIASFPEGSQGYLKNQLKEALNVSSQAQRNEIMERAFVKTMMGLEEEERENVLEKVENGSQFGPSIRFFPTVLKDLSAGTALNFLDIFPFDIPNYIIEEIINNKTEDRVKDFLNIYNCYINNNLDDLRKILFDNKTLDREEGEFILYYLMADRVSDAEKMISEITDSKIQKECQDIVEGFKSGKSTDPSTSFAHYWKEKNYTTASKYIKDAFMFDPFFQPILIDNFFKALCVEKKFFQALEICQEFKEDQRIFQKELAIIAISASLSPPPEGEWLVKEKILPKLMGTRYESIVKPYVEARWPSK